MNPEVINIQVPNNPHSNRHFCVKFDNATLQHINQTRAQELGAQHVIVYHDSKEVLAGINKDLQKMGNSNILYKPELTSIPKVDTVIEEDIFLLYDNSGFNYIHFFFDMFGRCYYFEQLKKQNPSLKLGIPEDLYQEEGRSNFIKQWLDLYLEGTDTDIIILKKDIVYKVNSLVLSNVYYWFPEPQGYGPIFEMIKKVADKVEPVETKSTGAYISRQDTIKRGWYHGRDLINEVALIEKIKSELGYDIIEMMDFSVREKIQLTKSYKTIIQQSSASNINLLFAANGSNSIILENPKMGPWLNAKCSDFAAVSKTNLVILQGVGECIVDTNIDIADKNNYPWQLTDIDAIIEILSSVEDGSIWN